MATDDTPQPVTAGRKVAVLALSAVLLVTMVTLAARLGTAHEGGGGGGGGIDFEPPDWSWEDMDWDWDAEPQDGSRDPNDGGSDGGDGGGDGGGSGDGSGSGTDSGSGSGSGGGDGSGSGGRTGDGPGGFGGSNPNAPSLTPPTLPPEILYWILGAIAVAVLVAAIYWYYQRIAPEWSGTKKGRRPAPTPLPKRLDFRLMPDDARDAVILVYAHFLQQASAHGVARLPHETPREHARAVAKDLDVPLEPLWKVVTAYEWARYTRYRIPEDLKPRAETGLRDFLGTLPPPPASADGTDGGADSKGASA